MRPLTLIPIAGVPRDDVTSLGDDLARAGFDVSVRHQRPVSAGSYDRTRRQYRAEALVEIAREESDDRVLVVTDLDIYARHFNFVFGLADPNANAGVISLRRLRVGADERLLRQRALKEALHELGHMEGLKHCATSRCVMHFSNSLVDSDRKDSAPCERCKQQMAS